MKGILVMRARTLVAFAAAATFALSTAACGDSDDTSDMGAAATTAAAASPTQAMAGMDGDEFGSGCAAVPTDPSNAGSFEAMAKVPVATAASGNPMLSTLVTAVQQAGLVDSLNTAPALTVFAPTNDAFAKIPKADLDKVLADKATLTKILTYHAVPQKLAPAQLAGTHTTLEGSELNVTGSGEDFSVGDATVVCGNVQTANATVYIIDTVLMPTA
ncbi:fasciclin domain-containing protein [Phytohabitans houttuyneae]|uniref:Lipoprotein n=2 Tax=Phytohabitans houttuyneae TaxID=1076126 RepID=A0A6V8KI93_9ACTN|nr:lipoprotein [Phytohabitans houttuyneae]